MNSVANRDKDQLDSVFNNNIGNLVLRIGACMSVVEHLQNPAETMQTIHAALRVFTAAAKEITDGSGNEQGKKAVVGMMGYLAKNLGTMRTFTFLVADRDQPDSNFNENIEKLVLSINTCMLLFEILPNQTETIESVHAALHVFTVAAREITRESGKKAVERWMDFLSSHLGSHVDRILSSNDDLLPQKITADTIGLAIALHKMLICSDPNDCNVFSKANVPPFYSVNAAAIRRLLPVLQYLWLNQGDAKDYKLFMGYIESGITTDIDEAYRQADASVELQASNKRPSDDYDFKFLSLVYLFQKRVFEAISQEMTGEIYEQLEKQCNNVKAIYSKAFNKNSFNQQLHFLIFHNAMTYFEEVLAKADSPLVPDHLYQTPQGSNESGWFNGWILLAFMAIGLGVGVLIYWRLKLVPKVSMGQVA